tara:strand:+ start:648 stop:1538 length:891 start_codon:yes stop_codon:yes gene_type:complete
MQKKTPIYVKFLIISLFSLSSCVSGCATVNLNQEDKKEILPRHTFTQIKHSIELEGCGKDPKTEKIACQKAMMRYVSSGAFVFRSEVSQSISYVMTAGHSCENKIPKVQNIDGYKVINKGSTFTVVDLEGTEYKARVVDINDRFDLCLLQVSDIYTEHPVLKVASEEPKKGETVINMAAPHGLFWPGSVLIFKGIFSGYHNRGYSIYTIPTKPGSSGSPVINKNNELVGVIFAGYSVIENVGLSSPLVAIKVFLKKAIAKGEMQLWEKANKTPNVNTKVDRIWIEEMNLKLENTFR